MTGNPAIGGYFATGGVGGGYFRKAKFKYGGSSALTAGYGMALNADVGTAANADEARSYTVETLTYANAFNFAGVLTQSYAAYADAVELYLPGGWAFCYTSETSTTVNSTILHCRADSSAPGVFVSRNGPCGPGSCLCSQTMSAAGLVLAYLHDGLQNGCVDILTCTAGGATNMMAHGGLTCFATATPASDATFTLAAGDFHGQRRSFQVEGTQTTNDILITLVGMKADGTTTFTTWEGDADAEDLNLVWDGAYWVAGVAGTGTYA